MGRKTLISIVFLGAIAALPATAAYDPENSVFISEVFPGSETIPSFLELYNASSTDIGLKGWRFRLYTKTGNEQFYLPYGVKIPSRGFFLVGKETDKDRWETLGVKPDYYAAAEMDYFTDGGGVILYKSTGATRDAIGWGTAPLPYYEGTPQKAPSAGESVERKSSALHSDQHGNAYDTGNNALDTYLRIYPEPQNNASPRETPSAGTESSAWGRVRAIYYRDE